MNRNSNTQKQILIDSDDNKQLSVVFDNSTPDVIRDSLANLIKLYRTRSGISGSELARRARLPQPRLSRIEQGKAAPSIQDIDQIASALHLKMRPKSKLFDLVRLLEATSGHNKPVNQIQVNPFMEYAEKEVASINVDIRTNSEIPLLLRTQERTLDLLKTLHSETDINIALNTMAYRQSQLLNRNKTFRFLSQVQILEKVKHDREWFLQLNHLLQFENFPNIEIRLLKEPSKVLFLDFSILDHKISFIDGYAQATQLPPKQSSMLAEQFETEWNRAMQWQDVRNIVKENIEQLISNNSYFDA